jgi:hypothetical protein
MTRYRLIVAHPREEQFLEGVIVDQDPASVLLVSEYRSGSVLELWSEPQAAPPLTPANDPGQTGPDF